MKFSQIRLIPPIMCRKGLLLLKPGNIQIIGGQVKSLADKYAQKRVLATVLYVSAVFLFLSHQFCEFFCNGILCAFRKADLEAFEKSAPPCPPPIAPAINPQPGLNAGVKNSASGS